MDFQKDSRDVIGKTWDDLKKSAACKILMENNKIQFFKAVSARWGCYIQIGKELTKCDSTLIVSIVIHNSYN